MPPAVFRFGSRRAGSYCEYNNEKCLKAGCFSVNAFINLFNNYFNISIKYD